MRRILAAFLFSLASLPVAATTPTDCSAVIVAGGMTQTIVTLGTANTELILQNLDANEALWFSLTGPAAIGSLGSYELPPSHSGGFSSGSIFVAPSLQGVIGPVSVVAASTGHKVTCTFW